MSSYVNVPTLEARLGCFNASDSFYLGVPTVAYRALAENEPVGFSELFLVGGLPRGRKGHVFVFNVLCSIEHRKHVCLFVWG